MGNNQDLAKAKSEPSKVLRAAMVMASGTMLSRIMGLVRDALIAALFSKTVSDAFIVAFRLPNMFRRILGEGSLSVSFMPVYVNARENQSDEEARRLADAIFSLLVIVTGVISALGIIFMPAIMKVIVGGEGYAAVAGKMATTIVLGRIIFGYVFLVTLYAYYMAIAQAHGKFWTSGLAPALFNFGVCIFALIPGQESSGVWLGVGTLFGGILQAGVIAWTLYGLDRLPRLSRQIFLPAARRVFINMGPSLAGLGVLQFMSIVNVYFASKLAEGSHSYIYWADRILEFPQALVAVSLGSAMLPRLSELIARKENDGVAKEMFGALRGLMFLVLPAAAGIYALSLPITEVLFRRGQFGLEDAQAVSRILELYSYLLVASSFVRVVVTGFYANQNTWFPALASSFVFVSHCFVAYFLVEAWGLNGLVTATVVSGFLNAILLLATFNTMVVKLDWLNFFRGLLPMLFPAMIMGCFSYLTFNVSLALSLVFLPAALAKLICLSLVVPLSGVLYFYFCMVLQIPEAKTTLFKISHRLPEGFFKRLLSRWT